ncbi:conjugative transposon protein TraM [Algoriphagus sp.]|uniref:conjugative transposon protein TraM n=1 Tax=Algoriphagus sp. TaxID=1872435 RepID=UPI00261AA121|nr:conjugative transposon protein TraM [Algoriphagus sp.]
MMNKQTQLAERRKGVFLLCLPVLIVPLVFLLGSTGGEIPVLEEIPKGLNQELPQVLIKEKRTSKPEAYTLEEKWKKESPDLELPAFLQQSLVDQQPKEGNPKEEQKESLIGLSFSSSSPQTGFSTHSSPALDQSKEILDPEKAMADQLKELEKLLNSEPKDLMTAESSADSFSQKLSAELLQARKEWENPMGELQGGSGPDPELEQLEGLLDKLVFLQQGADQVESTEEFSRLNGIKPVAISTNSEKESSAGVAKRSFSIQEEGGNGFFGFVNQEEPQEFPNSFPSTIKAHVAESQQILPGEAVELILDQDLILEELQIPAGTLLHAGSSMSGARLQLRVSGIVWKDQLIPVDLKAYGLDGLPGVEIADQKGASQWLNQSVQGAQGMRFNTLGMDWQSQLATTGVDASRSLIRSKSRPKKLQVKGGHPVLLIDFSQAKTP